jgi:hypothetical protein
MSEGEEDAKNSSLNEEQEEENDHDHDEDEEDNDDDKRYYYNQFEWPPSSSSDSKTKKPRTSSDAIKKPPSNLYDIKVAFKDFDYQDPCNVTAKVKDAKTGELVGCFQATLLDRPSPSFFEQADAASQGLLEVSSVFCKPNGVASRIQHHPRLQKSDPAIFSGGFLYIDQLEVNPSHRGQSDLGLGILHEVLILLEELWTFCAMTTYCLPREYCQWKHNAPLPSAVELTRQERDRNEAAVQRHFARMGFAPAGPDNPRAWFITSTVYFGTNNNASSNDDDDAELDSVEIMSRWLSKEQVAKEEADVKVKAQTEHTIVTGAEKALADFVQGIKSNQEAANGDEHKPKGLYEAIINCNSTGTAHPPLYPEDVSLRNIQRIEELLPTTAGAAAAECIIHNSRALFHAAALDIDDMHVMATLVRLGGNVNLSNEHGDCPLHIAARNMRPRTISFLLDVAGADASLSNNDGETPLETLEYAIQVMGDSDAPWGCSLSSRIPNETQVMAKLNSLRALIPQETRALLRDGWMSPRMEQNLTFTADLTTDNMKFSTPDEHVNLEYIPVSILDKAAASEQVWTKFRSGWIQCWRAMWELLQQ